MSRRSFGKGGTSSGCRYSPASRVLLPTELSGPAFGMVVKMPTGVPASPPGGPGFESPALPLTPASGQGASGRHRGMAQVLKSIPATHWEARSGYLGPGFCQLRAFIHFFQINLFERQIDMGEGKGGVLQPLVHSPKMPSRAGAGPGCIRVSCMGGRGPSTWATCCCCFAPRRVGGELDQSGAPRCATCWPLWRHRAWWWLGGAGVG